MVVANPVKPEADDYSVDGKEAAEIYSEIVGEETPIIPIEYLDGNDGSKRDANEIVSLEQAAHDLTAWREFSGRREGCFRLEGFSNEIDEQRAEAAKEGEDLKSRGVENPEEGTDAKTVDIADAKEADPALAHLDPEIQAALQNPKIRGALEAEFGKAEQAHQQYSQTLQAAQTIAQATLATIAPELGQIPPHLWEGALQAIAQTDPGRAQTIVNTLDKAQRIQFATQQQAQQQAQIAQQQNDALRQQYAKASDEALAMTTAVWQWPTSS